MAVSGALRYLVSFLCVHILLDTYSHFQSSSTCCSVLRRTARHNSRIAYSREKWAQVWRTSPWTSHRAVSGLSHQISAHRRAESGRPRPRTRRRAYNVGTTTGVIGLLIPSLPPANRLCAPLLVGTFGRAGRGEGGSPGGPCRLPGTARGRRPTFTIKPLGTFIEFLAHSPWTSRSSAWLS